MELIETLKAEINNLLVRVTPDDVVIGQLKDNEALAETRSEDWSNPSTIDEAERLVRQIVADFKFLVEERRLSELLYREDGRPRHERFAQMLFFAVAYARCKAYDLDVTPEADTGNGPVDFKFSKGFSARILVEIKLSTNGQAVHGVERQLPKYSEAEETSRGLFVFVDVGRAGKKWKRISGLCSAHLPKGVVGAAYVDGFRRASASNLPADA